MFKFNKEFREAHPETVGETDYEFDLENYKDWLENEVVKKNDLLHSVTQRSELLKGDYRQHFIDWKNKYFKYEPKTYEYKSIAQSKRYTLNGLHRFYKRAMLQSPFNCG